MKNNFKNYLLKHGFIEKFQTPSTEYFRLVTEVMFDIDSEKISLLKNEYTPEFEKGGVFLVAPENKNGRRIFNVEEIIFVTNRSETPDRSYRPDKEELKLVRANAFKKNLLPFDFHSHPTKCENIFMESMLYHRQLDTSLSDKIYQRDGIQLENVKLRLPEILVVANGTLKSGLFIGFYSGLIAPLDFTDRKNEVMHDFFQNNFDRISNYFDTPEKKVLGTVGGIAAAIGLFVLFSKYPKAIFPSLVSTAMVVPSLAYSSSKTTEFFGVSNGHALKIVIPKISDDLVIKNEELILKLYEEWKKRQKGNH